MRSLRRTASGRLRRLFRPANELLAATAGVRLVSAGAVGVRVNDEWVTRFLYFDRLVERIAGLEGDVVECGVAGGQSLAMFASLLRARGQRRRIWGFDSFAGLPDPTEADRVTNESAAAGGMFDWASEDLVWREVAAHGFSDDEARSTVRLVKGAFAETIPSHPGAAIALLHVDADLYASYRLALEHFWPRLVRGGVAAFDEYEEAASWPGVRRAVDEYLARADVSADLQRDDAAAKWYAVKTG